MSPLEIRQLYDYNLWANHRSISAAEKLSPARFAQPLGSSFSSVRDTLAHICGAEWIWLERFHGNSPSSLPAVEFNNAEGLRTHWSHQEVRLLEFVRGLSPSDLDRDFEYTTLKFGIYRNPLWQSLMHLVNHGSYHRGQVTTMLRQLGAQPLSTDLVHFYREQSLAKSA